MAQGMILWEMSCSHHYEIQQLAMGTAYLFIDVKPFPPRRPMRIAAPVEVTCSHSGYTQMQLKAMLYGCFLEVYKYLCGCHYSGHCSTYCDICKNLPIKSTISG